MKAIIQSKIIFAALIVITILFAGIRFVNIDADFPENLTRSGVLYTDEGFWSNGAISNVLVDKWHIEGDYNPIVNLPMGQLIQSVSFSIFGLSIASARTTTVLFFIVLLLLTYFLARQYADHSTAVFSVLFLSANFFLFSYSRLAILDILMTTFVVLAFLIISFFKDTNTLWPVVVSSLVLFVALLTKSTAVFSIPVFLYLLYLNGSDKKNRIQSICIGIVVLCVSMSLFSYFMSHNYNSDYLYFNSSNIGNKISFSPFNIIMYFFVATVKAYCIEPVLYSFSIICSIILIIRSERFKHNNLVRISFVWIIMYFGLLSISWYQPARYFLPVSVPVAFLFGSSLSLLGQYKNKYIAPFTIQLLVIFYLLSVNGYKIASYIKNPRFTFVDMANDVQQIVIADGHSTQEGILLGNMAGNVSLETGIHSINTDKGTRTLEWKIEEYRPRFYISLGNEPDVVKILNRYYDIKKIDEWDVFNNYKNKKVLLFQLIDK